MSRYLEELAGAERREACARNDRAMALERPILPDVTPAGPVPDDVRAARVAASLTQSQAGSLIGAAMRTFQDWESGARNMPVAKWALFCILTGYPKLQPQQQPGDLSPE